MAGAKGWRWVWRAAGLAAGLVFAWVWTAAAADAGQVTLAWDPSSSDDVVGYKVHIGTEPGVYTQVVDAGLQTTTTVANLEAGVVYHFAATAYDSAGVESGFSNEVSHSFPAPEEDNQVPLASEISLEMLEDTNVAVGLAGSDADGDPLEYVVVQAPAYGQLSGTPPNLVYTPMMDFNGGDQFRYVVSDGQATSGAATVSIAVVAVNDAPGFVRGSDVTVPQNAPLQTLAGWACNLQTGPTNEWDQGLQFNLAVSAPGLFVQGPAVATCGTLTFAPAPGCRGVATVTLQLWDDGGTANGGQNASGIQSMTITVGDATDTDGDSMPDDYELACGLDPESSADGDLDRDGDGFTNAQEWTAGTSAADAADALRILTVQTIGADMQVRFSTAVGKQYRVERSLDFPNGTWSVVAEDLAGVDGAVEWMDLGAASRVSQAYRVVAEATVVSEPAGTHRLTLLGTSENVLSFPFARATVAAGRVQSVAGNVVVIDGNPAWAANQFVYDGVNQRDTYHLRLRDGAQAGSYFTITANDAASVTVDLAGDLLDKVSVGDRIEIIPYWTLGTAFVGGQGIQPSVSATDHGTELLIPAYDAQGTELPAAATYYWMSGHWYGVGLTGERDDDVLLPDAFVKVRHLKTGNTVYPASGAIVQGAWNIPVILNSKSKQDYLVALPLPIGVSLKQSRLYESRAFRTSRSTRATVDELYVYNNAVATFNKKPVATYYHYAGAWRRRDQAATYDAGDEVAFRPGMAVIIRKAADTGAYDWTIPPQY